MNIQYLDSNLTNVNENIIIYSKQIFTLYKYVKIYSNLTLPKLPQFLKQYVVIFILNEITWNNKQIKAW